MQTKLAMIALLMALTSGAWAQSRQVAITIDDLPRGLDGGARDLAAVRPMTITLLQTFSSERVPVTGFVNAGRFEGSAAELRQILDLWLDAGADLGNHTYSHLDLNKVPLADYTADLEKGATALRETLAARGKPLSYFRHPYLHLGASAADKRGLQKYLDAQGYRVAPVTFDDSDYMFAALYLRPEYREQVRREYVPYMESMVEFFETRSVEVVGREIPQVLLIHASQLNADLMPELLAMFRRRGYAFVSLDRALADPAYQLPEDYVGRSGVSWIERWSWFKNMPPRAEPDPPAWVTRAFEQR